MPRRRSPALRTIRAGAAGHDVVLRTGWSMGLEQLAMSGVAAVGRHRRVADALFHFTKWGNPFADERFSWPYPMYDRMRADGPVTYGRPYRQWFVFGYDEVQEVLRSPHTATAPVGELLLSTSRVSQTDSDCEVELRPMAVDQRCTRSHPIAGRGESGVHTRQIDGYEPLIRQAVAGLVDELDTTARSTSSRRSRAGCRSRRSRRSSGYRSIVDNGCWKRPGKSAECWSR